MAIFLSTISEKQVQKIESKLDTVMVILPCLFITVISIPGVNYHTIY